MPCIHPLPWKPLNTAERKRGTLFIGWESTTKQLFNMSWWPEKNVFNTTWTFQPKLRFTHWITPDEYTAACTKYHCTNHNRFLGPEE
jgi:hypothetical protein